MAANTGPTALLLVVGVVAPFALATGPDSSSIYVAGEPGASGLTVYAPAAVFLGEPLVNVSAPAQEDCAASCRAQNACSWFNFCGQQEGCEGASSCQLLSSNCSLTPQLAGTGGPGYSAGFPIRVPPLELPGYSTRTAQGMQGVDFECGVSIQPGACVVPSAMDGAMICSFIPECRSVVVFTNGTDGCSGQELAVLKRSSLTPSNSFVSPAVFTLESVQDAQLTATYLGSSETTVVAPDEAELEAAYSAGADLSNSTAWLGCIVAERALMGGDVLEVLDGVGSAEACCRECRARDDDSCNVFNYCAQPQGCSYTDMRTEVRLNQSQCELRYQALAEPALGWPAFVIAKGEGVSFVGGSPIEVAGPNVPGYTRLLGSGLFGQQGFDCEGSLSPELQECLRAGPVQELADYCTEDPLCRALVYKPAGVYLSQANVAYFRHEEGANISNLIRTPSSVLYVREEEPSSSSSSLSSGAIAGIAVGVVAAAAAAAALLWLLVGQRKWCSKVAAGGSSGPASRVVGAGAEGSENKASNPEIVTDRQQSTQDDSFPTAGPQPGTLGLPPAAVLPGAVPSMTPSDSSLGQLPSGTATLGPSPRLSRPVPTSPFAALSMMRPRLAPPMELGAERTEEVLELLQHRARQDASGNTASSGALSSSRTHTSGSSSTPSRLVSATLPPSLMEWVIPASAIEYLRRSDGSLQLLGEGASGKVLRALYHGEKVAAKEIKLDSTPEAAQAFVREAVQLQGLRHPNVVGFFGVSLDEGNKGTIVLEYCEGRDLQSALHLRTSRTQERVFGWYRSGRRVAFEVAKALNFLHSKGVVHLDVKSSNVLLTSSGTAKLADVGVSRLQTRTFLSDLPGMIGTFAWVAPEILMSQPSTQAVDIFSFGVLLWEIITSERPVRGQLRLPVVPDECPQRVADLLLECLSLDPAGRPTAQQLMHRLEAMQGRVNIGSATDDRAAFLAATPAHRLDPQPVQPVNPRLSCALLLAATLQLYFLTQLN